MNEQQLNEALQAWPLEDVPAGFADGVIAHVEARQLPVPTHQEMKLKFRLTWVDYLLGFSLSAIPVVGFVAFTFLPRKFLLYVSYQWLVLRSPAYEPVLLALVGVAGMVASLAFLIGLRYIFPRKIALF